MGLLDRLTGRVGRGGAGRMLLLVHGMGGGTGVWAPFCQDQPLLDHFGDVAVVALPGHGAPVAGATPSFGEMAALLAPHIAGARDVTILGHSLGGVVGLELAASAAGANVTRTVALGVKVSWTDDELQRVGSVAAKPMRVFASRAQAEERAAAIAGLTGPAVPPAAFLRAAVAEVEGGWQPTFDPKMLAVGRPQMGRLVAEAHGEVVLARGEHDPMQSDDELAGFGVQTETLPGLGHSPHVEDPAAVLALVV